MTTGTTSSLRPIQLPEPDRVFGCTAGMRAVRMTIEAAIRDDLPVLIEGESGTGKEVVARYLHLNSRRSAGAFVRVDCGWMQGSMLGRQILGRVSCNADKPRNEGGCDPFGTASGGTLFFDGIADMKWDVKRWLAEGLRGAASVNARIVCASKSSPRLDIGDDSLSDELSSCFGHRVRLLPLRERKQDIPILCEYLIGKFAANFGRSTPKLSSSVLETFQQLNWPGNIRELENWIARIVIFGTEEAIGPEFRRQMGAGGKLVSRSHRAVNLNLTLRRRSRRHS
jgi:DNA-binding NtrC family response regulator